MREIKFRAWIKKENIMLRTIRALWEGAKGSGSLKWINERDCNHREHNLDLTNKLYGYDGEDIELMQYTGLKDKNGVEIYEGDIIFCESWKPEKYVIQFADGGFGLGYTTELCLLVDIAMIEDSTGKHFEVIGNIYENPELLKS